MNIDNAWKTIPLEDYEKHMQFDSVAQAQLLNFLTQKYLQIYDPQNLLFLGISGGNGLEHVNEIKVKQVYGIDINQAYLEVTRKRFGEKIKQLILVNTDIANSNEVFLKADFVWAALIFEYIEIQKGLEFISNNIGESGKLVVTIQSNNGSQSVSQTGVESIKRIKKIFKLVDKDDLQMKALAFGLLFINSEENILPNGKSLITLEFEKRML